MSSKLTHMSSSFSLTTMLKSGGASGRQSNNLSRNFRRIVLCNVLANSRFGGLYTNFNGFTLVLFFIGNDRVKKGAHARVLNVSQFNSCGELTVWTFAYMLVLVVIIDTFRSGQVTSSGLYTTPVAAFQSSMRLLSVNRRITYTVSPSGTP